MFGCLLLLSLPALAAPEIHFVEKETVSVKVWPLTAGAADGSTHARTLVITDGEEGRAELELPWPDASSPSRLILRGVRRVAPAGSAHRILLEAELRGTDGSATRSERVLTFDRETSALFDVARHGERTLTLAVEAEYEKELVPSARPTVGRPLQLFLEIQYVEGERAVSLETNELNTFVGHEVSYSFRLGEPGRSESAEIRLLPVQVLGDVSRIEVRVSATLPGEDGEPHLFSRREQWVTTRDATSSLDVLNGEPPTGFRFRLTPRF